MNQLECKQLLKLLENGDLELLKTYIEDKMLECKAKQAVEEHNANIEAVKSLRCEKKPFFFPYSDGKFVLGCSNSIYILNSNILVEEYNERVRTRKKGYYYRYPFHIEDDPEIVDKIKEFIEKKEKAKFYEIGETKKYTEPAEAGDGMVTVLQVSSKDALINHSFNKCVVDYARHFLGKEVVFYVNRETPMLLAESRSGRGYILGRNPQKPEEGK